jgi:hypothetical protein
MADQYRDSCIDRQNVNRKGLNGNPVDPIRVCFFDKDGQKISDVTRSEANCIAGLNPQQKFYFQDGNGYLRELLIADVNKLSTNDCLRSTTISGQFTSGVGNGDSDSTLNSAVEQANDPAINQLLDKAKIDIPTDLGDF